MGATLNLALRKTALIAGVLATGMLLGACTKQNEGELLSSAKSYLDRRDNGGAIVQLKSALQLNANSGEGRYLLGRALLNTGAGRDAALELTKARELGYDDNLVAPALAEALLTSGQAKRLIELFVGTTLTDAVAGAALKSTLASAYQRQGLFDRSATEVQAALRLNPKDVNARLLQARLVAGQNRFDEAEALADKLTVDAPNEASAWILKGEMRWMGRADRVGGGKAFQHALTLDPKNSHAHTALLQMHLQQNDVAAFKQQLGSLRQALPDSFAAQFYTVMLAFMEKNLAAAQTGVQQLLKITRDYPPVLQLAGAIGLQANELTQAQTYLTQAMQLTPDMPGPRRMLAEAQLRGGSPDKALLTLKSLIEQPQPAAEILALAAQAFLQVGDSAKAEFYYGLAAKADPNDSRSRAVLALAQVGKGQSDAGFAELESIAQSDKGTYADLALISAYLSKNDIERALTAVNRLVAKDTGKPLPYLLRARIMLLRDDVLRARADFEAALQKDPVYFPAAAELAALDVKENKAVDARKRFDDMLVREPRSLQARLAIVDLQQRAGATPAEIEALLRDAIKLNPSEPAPRARLVVHYLLQRQAKAALAAAQEGVAALPSNLTLQDALGRAQLAAGDSQQAVRTFQKIVAAQPNAPEPHLRMAEVYLAAKDYAAAEQSLQRAREVAPKLPAAYQQLARLYLDRKRPAEALQAAKRLQKERPTDSAGWVLEAEVQASQRRWDPAIAALRTAMDRSANTNLAMRQHTLYVTAGKSAEAGRFALEWMGKHPSDTDFLFHLGALAMDRNEHVEAEARFREVLAQRPRSAAALNNIAVLMLKQGKAGALAVAEQAYQLAPQQAAVMDTLASTLARGAELNRALELQKKAVAQEPTAPTYRLNLAKLLIQSGDRSQARVELEKLATLGGRFAGQAEVAGLLKTL